VWLASVGAGGAVLGLLAAFLIMGRGDAREFGQYPQVYCTTAGGQVVTNPEGRRFCAIWIDRPSQSGADLAAPAFFMANPPLATSAGSGLPGAIRAKGLVLLVLPTE
jgi:hypothetical protein